MGVMSKHIDSAPAAKKVVPSGPDWLHEVKHHGYRAVAWSATARARVCFPRPAWTGTWRSPWIVEAATDPPEPVHHRRRDLRARRPGHLGLLYLAFRPARRRGPALRLRHHGDERRRSPRAAAVRAQGEARSGEFGAKTSSIAICR